MNYTLNVYFLESPHSAHTLTIPYVKSPEKNMIDVSDSTFLNNLQYIWLNTILAHDTTCIYYPANLYLYSGIRTFS